MSLPKTRDPAGRTEEAADRSLAGALAAAAYVAVSGAIEGDLGVQLGFAAAAAVNGALGLLTQWIRDRLGKPIAVAAGLQEHQRRGAYLLDDEK